MKRGSSAPHQLKERDAPGPQIDSDVPRTVFPVMLSSSSPHLDGVQSSQASDAVPAFSFKVDNVEKWFQVVVIQEVFFEAHPLLIQVRSPPPLVATPLRCPLRARIASHQP